MCTKAAVQDISNEPLVQQHFSNRKSHKNCIWEEICGIHWMHFIVSSRHRHRLSVNPYEFCEQYHNDPAGTASHFPHTEHSSRRGHS